MADSKGVGKSLVALDTTIPTVTVSKAPKNVLDEDAYTEKLEKIIVRDFYPDLPKLREKQEYLDALQRNDTEKLRQLHLKYTKRTPGTLRPASMLPTPSSSFETPIENPKESVPELDDMFGSLVGGSGGAEGSDRGGGAKTDHQKQQPYRNPEPKPVRKTKDDVDLPLDKFLAKNTSEDNQSFKDIMAESEKKHRLKHAWLFDQEALSTSDLSERLALPSVEQQAIMDSNHKVDTWTYQAKNAVMYFPEGIEMTSEDKMKVKAKGSRVIEHGNTRFSANPFSATNQSVKEAASTQTALLMGKVGVDGKEVLPKATPRVNGYGFLATPTPAPGVEDTPLMTWGEIEGTPFGLDGGGTPLLHNPTSGPQFKIPDVPRRDRLGFELAEKASKAHRDKKNAAIQRVQRNIASPSPKFAASKTDRLTGLSPAAQKLASSRLGINMGSDRALSDSYTPSPMRRKDKTPGLTPTPSPLAGRTNRTPTQTAKRPTTGGVGSLTDNLLIIPKRSKQSD